MNRQRAEEIAASPEMANVIYNGKAVYIQHVEDNENARIYPIDKPEQEITVPLSSLIEN